MEIPRAYGMLENSAYCCVRDQNCRFDRKIIPNVVDIAFGVG